MRISGCGRTPCATRSASSARRRWSASVAENGVDPAPLWQAYIDAGWTELTDPGERGRAGDRAGGARPRHRSDAVPGDVDAVRAAGRRPLRPAARGRRRSTTASPPIATPTAGCSTERHITSSTPTGPSGSRSSPRRGVFVVDAGDGRHPAQPGLRSGAAHRRGVVRRRAAARHRTRARRRREGPARGAHRDGDHHGRRVPAHPRPGARAREAAPAVRRRDRHRSRPSSTRPSTCTSPPSAPARCPTSRR